MKPIELKQSQLTQLEFGFWQYNDDILVRTGGDSWKAKYITHDEKATGWFMKPKGGFNGCENIGTVTNRYYLVTTKKSANRLADMEDFIKNRLWEVHNKKNPDFLYYANKIIS